MPAALYQYFSYKRALLPKALLKFNISSSVQWHLWRQHPPPDGSWPPGSLGRQSKARPPPKRPIRVLNAQNFSTESFHRIFSTLHFSEVVDFVIKFRCTLRLKMCKRYGSNKHIWCFWQSVKAKKMTEGGEKITRIFLSQVKQKPSFDIFSCFSSSIPTLFIDSLIHSLCLILT